MKASITKLIYRPIFISSIIILTGIAAYRGNNSFLDVMEKKTIDIRFSIRGPVQPQAPIVIAAIDEKSVHAEGKWPWPRKKIAALVSKLAQAGCKIIAFDVIFSEPESSDTLHAIQLIENKVRQLKLDNDVLSDYFLSLKQKTDSDNALAAALKNADAKIVLGYFLKTGDTNQIPASSQETETHRQNNRQSRYDYVRSHSSSNAPLHFWQASGFESNIQQFSQNSEYTGYFNMSPDTDGVIRWLRAVYQFGDELYAPLALKVVQAYKNSAISIEAAENMLKTIEIDDISIPTDIGGEIMINYRGKSHTFLHIPVTDILNDKIDRSQLRDKIVLIGATAVGIYDMRVTPFSETFPGVEIHANLIDTILNRDFLYKPEYGKLLDIIAIILAGFIPCGVLVRTGALSSAIISIFFFGGYIMFCQYVFSTTGWVLNMVYPLSTLVLVYIAITAHKYVTAERKKQFIKNAFSTYLAPSVVKEIIKTPHKLNLGGEQRDITAFFSDVQGFTAISERMSPTELVELLNEFLTEMTDIILMHEGTVDKFEGDAIIAFFGAPNTMPDHARKACLASIAMQQKLVELRRKWKDEGKPELRMRIGLCSGGAVVGNMGSKNRMDYTMMGDTVNTAARLEGVNKVYGTYTLIGHTTRQQLNGAIRVREVDAVHVVGRQTPISIYELISDAGLETDLTDDLLNSYADGLSYYRNQEFDLAIKIFDTILEQIPGDGPSRTMRARCSAYIKEPPPKKWSGAFSMTEK